MNSSFSMRSLVFFLCWMLCGSALAFDLQGHRGARGLAPENTLAGFRQALAIGVTTLELDVGVTADGHVVIAHDPRLNPDLARDASGAWLAAPGPPLSTLTLAELKRFDVGRIRPGTRYAQTCATQRGADGERVPTLASLFDLVRASGNDRVRFNIETKLSPLAPELTPEPEAFARALLEVVRRHGMAGRTTVQSFDWRTLRAVQRLAPELPIAALTARLQGVDNLGDARWTAGLRLEDHGGSVPRLVKALGASTWSPFHGELTEALLAEAHALGLQVVPWTVNDPERIARLLGWGVDGLISDHPDRVREALARRGMALPSPVP
ncbi:MAG TPA: glycerophosphodiester phosphodiesterase [Rubrivivax sp.]|nr:glycerophosphodiester phosphodiesterase [Rubrivivax sp.]